MRTKRKKKMKHKKTKKVYRSKLVQDILKEKKSYSPLVRSRVKILNPKSPAKDIFNVQKCGKYNIPLTLKNKKYKCLKWNSKKAQQIMLNHLYSKNKINPEEIIAPKQVLSNCWFNSFFMVFFISDKARKFFEYIRKTMITGILPSGKSVNKNMRKPLWLLNRYINASLVGTSDPVIFALRMDTNELIRSLYSNLKKTKKKVEDLIIGDVIVKTRKAGNPLDYYLRLIHNLEDRNIKYLHLQNKIFSELTHKLNNIKYIPEVIIIENWERKTDENFSTNFTFNGNKYTVDSAILRSLNGAHFTAYITINGSEYMFDGERYVTPNKYGKLSQKTLSKFKWKEKINSKSKWKTERKNEEAFSFSKEYITLIYYLDSKKIKS